MATYNPRAGLPPRKKYDTGVLNNAKPKSWLETTIAKLLNEGDAAALQSIAHPEPGNIAWLEEGMDANALRGWLLGYMDSIGDQLPDLAQWRRIREEVGRSVAVKEPVKDTAVPVKKVAEQHVPYDKVVEALIQSTKERQREAADKARQAEQKVLADYYKAMSPAHTHPCVPYYAGGMSGNSTLVVPQNGGYAAPNQGLSREYGQALGQALNANLASGLNDIFDNRSF